MTFTGLERCGSGVTMQAISSTIGNDVAAPPFVRCANWKRQAWRWNTMKTIPRSRATNGCAC